MVTPIFGGAARTRAVNRLDVIRAASVRGHLRFWWRALHAPNHGHVRELHAAEAALWGRAAGESGGRSEVELRISVSEEGEVDESDINLQATPGAYALWPAREEKGTQTPVMARREAGTRFTLTLRGPADQEPSLKRTLSAWILFGGYGGRTRRGLGSLTVLEHQDRWLPATASKDGLTALFEADVLTSAGPARHVPTLAGATVLVGPPADAQQAWTRALDWLKEFRQGHEGTPGNRAREPGAGKLLPRRPSVSNWPEADKVRRLSVPPHGLPWAHPPRHNATPVWPRAGFGLPIIGQFQKRDRAGNPWANSIEPTGFEIRWHDGDSERDRLASPLIVKALALADKTFVPCALWLHRAYPQGTVRLRDNPGSAAPFDRLVAENDQPQFGSLTGKTSLREAFVEWLLAKPKVRTLT